MNSILNSAWTFKAEIEIKTHLDKENYVYCQRPTLFWRKYSMNKENDQKKCKKEWWAKKLVKKKKSGSSREILIPYNNKYDS